MDDTASIQHRGVSCVATIWAVVLLVGLVVGAMILAFSSARHVLTSSSVTLRIVACDRDTGEPIEGVVALVAAVAGHPTDVDWRAECLRDVRKLGHDAKRANLGCLYGISGTDGVILAEGEVPWSFSDIPVLSDLRGRSMPEYLGVEIVVLTHPRYNDLRLERGAGWTWRTESHGACGHADAGTVFLTKRAD